MSANAKIEVTASTFDVAFNEFHTWKGETDANGHAKFEIKLPDYFVGQPLQKGDAMVKLDVKVLDSADHSETVVKTYPVSDQPVRISLIAEGGKIVPNMDNRIFVAAIYPDGSPAPNTRSSCCIEKLPTPPNRVSAAGGLRGPRWSVQPAPPQPAQVKDPASRRKEEPKRSRLPR